jgi:hypothetical protein
VGTEAAALVGGKLLGQDAAVWRQRVLDQPLGGDNGVADEVTTVGARHGGSLNDNSLYRNMIKTSCQIQRVGRLELEGLAQHVEPAPGSAAQVGLFLQHGQKVVMAQEHGRRAQGLAPDFFQSGNEGTLSLGLIAGI